MLLEDVVESSVGVWLWVEDFRGVVRRVRLLSAVVNFTGIRLIQDPS